MHQAGTINAHDNATATPHTSGGNSAHDNATPHTEPDNAPEPDNAAPDATARTAPERSEQPTHTHTPQTHQNHAHATPGTPHATPAAAPNTPALRTDNPRRAPRVCFSALPVPVAPECYAQVHALAIAAGLDPPDGSPVDAVRAVLTGVEHLSPFAPARATMFLSIVASGARHREAFQASGLSQIDINLFCKLDESFGKLYDLAKRLQGDSIAQQTLDAARDRAIDGVDEPMIGRVGKDQDGIITYRKRYSDKLAEVLLKATDSRFRDAAPTTQNAATIYNIQVVRQDDHGNGPDDQPSHNSGGKTAAKQHSESQVIDVEALTLD